jgi:hypothetical protein
MAQAGGGTQGARRIEDELAQAFERTVAEGHRRLTRTWPGLLATGTVGGIDISTGILGLLIVHNATNNARKSARFAVDTTDFVADFLAALVAALPGCP